MEQTEADQQSDKPILNISGDKIALGPMQKSMIPAFVRWENDFAVALMSGDPIRPVSRESIEARFERELKDESHRGVDFAIYERASMRLIGIAGLKHIDKTRRTAE